MTLRARFRLQHVESCGASATAFNVQFDVAVPPPSTY